MDAYGVPSRRSHHGQFGGVRGGGLKPAGSSSHKTSMAMVRPSLFTGLVFGLAAPLFPVWVTIAFFSAAALLGFVAILLYTQLTPNGASVDA